MRPPLRVNFTGFEWDFASLNIVSVTRSIGRSMPLGLETAMLNAKCEKRIFMTCSLDINLTLEAKVARAGKENPLMRKENL